MIILKLSEYRTANPPLILSSPQSCSARICRCALSRATISNILWYFCWWFGAWYDNQCANVITSIISLIYRTLKKWFSGTPAHAKNVQSGASPWTLVRVWTLICTPSGATRPLCQHDIFLRLAFWDLVVVCFCETGSELYSCSCRYGKILFWVCAEIANQMFVNMHTLSCSHEIVNQMFVNIPSSSYDQ